MQEKGKYSVQLSNHMLGRTLVALKQRLALGSIEESVQCPCLQVPAT